MLDHRPAGQRQRPLQQPMRLRAVAAGQPHLGEPLQAVRLARRGVDVAVQVDRLGQLALGPVEVALQQRRLADQGGGERDPAQRTGVRRPTAQLLGLLDHLGVGHRPVEHVLGHAQVRVEQRRDQPLLALGPPQLDPEALEPLAALVGDQPLQRDQVHQVPLVVRGVQRLPRLAGDRPGGVDVAGEVGDVARAASRIGAVGRVALRLQPGQRGRAVSRSPANAAARASRARTSRCVGAGRHRRAPPGRPTSPPGRRSPAAGRRAGPAAAAARRGSRAARTPSTRVSASR